MVKVCVYEEVPKLETVVVSIGGAAIEVSNQFSPDFKTADSVKTLTSDSKEAPGVEVVLDLNVVRKILSSPDVYKRQYGIDVPRITPEEVDRFQEGLMLERDSIGPILSISSEEKIMRETLGKVKLAVEGADEAREQGLPVLKDLQFNCNASTGGGTGSSIILPHCSVIKRYYPKSCVNLVTSFDYIAEAIPSIEAGETILRNIRGFLEELIDMEEKRK
ncbi:MAG: hypothetical protein N2V75_07180 [Methanophagales archaeon]|nr:hypothetical protein [Methanophagales archaeon]